MYKYYSYMCIIRYEESCTQCLTYCIKAFINTIIKTWLRY